MALCEYQDLNNFVTDVKGKDEMNHEGRLFIVGYFNKTINCL